MPLRRIAGVRDRLTLVRLGVFVLCLGALAHTSADPDLWGHLRFGADILAARAVVRTDSYSFSSDRPWINHEWLSEALMAAAYGSFGTAGLVVLKVALVLGVLLLAMRELRVLPQVMMRDRLIALLALAIVTRTFSFRPQVFSLLLFALLLASMLAAERGRAVALAGMPLVMAFWSNLHGGWLVGLPVLGVWLAFAALDPQRTWKGRLMLAGAGVASVAATLINPYGFGLWRFVRATVGLTRADVADWQPMYSMPLPVIAVWLLVLTVGVAILVRVRRACPFRCVAVVGLLAVLSLRVSRIDAFLAIAVVMLLGPQLAKAPMPAPEAVRRTVARTLSAGGATALAAAMLVPGFVVARQSAGCVDVPGGFPEPQAAQFVVANHLRGRIVTWFGWGEYAIWHFSPDLRVSIDGRRETVYSDQIIKENWQFATVASPPALDYADRVNADYVWMPNTAPAAAALEARGWVRIFHGPVSTIFARHPADRYLQSGAQTSIRCFPGP